MDVYPSTIPSPQAHDAHPGISEYVATIIADAAERFAWRKFFARVYVASDSKKLKTIFETALI